MKYIREYSLTVTSSQNSKNETTLLASEQTKKDIGIFNDAHLKIVYSGAWFAV